MVRVVAKRRGGEYTVGLHWGFPKTKGPFCQDFCDLEFVWGEFEAIYQNFFEPFPTGIVQAPRIPQHGKESFLC